MEYLKQNILFLDIETVSEHENFNDMPVGLQSLWSKKSQHQISRNQALTPEVLYQSKAGIYAEFSKVICISIGYLTQDLKTLRVKSFYHKNERSLLNCFVELINKFYFDKTESAFCGHNIREFDIPFLCRRMLKHRITIPTILNLTHTKPWESKHIIDTLALWRFGDYKNYISLDLLANVLAIESSKTDISGADVHEVYYKQKNIARIRDYCEMDVLTTSKIYLRLCQVEIEEPINLLSVNV